MSRGMLMLIALLANAAGIYLFVQWLIQTDVMFGHYSGPPAMLFLSTCLVAAGLGATAGWLGSAVRSRMRGLKSSRSGVVAGVLLSLLAIPAGLAFAFGGLASLDELGFFERTVKTTDDYIADLATGDASARAGALFRLGQGASGSRSAIPAIRDAMGDPDAYVRVCAAEALWKITDEADAALPVLIEALEQEYAEPHACKVAIRTLRDMETQARGAVPALERIARGHESSDVRVEAAAAVWTIGGEIETALPALVEALEENDLTQDGQLKAIGTLRSMGDKALAAVPALQATARSNPDSRARVWAADSVAAITGDAGETVAVLIDVLEAEDAEPASRLEAINALGELGEAASEAVPVLEEFARDPSNSVFSRAATRALERIAL